LQGLAQEIAVNSAVVSFESNHLRLELSPELREIINSNIEAEIQHAVENKLNVSCRLEFIAQPNLISETPSQARIRQRNAQRKAAISKIKESEVMIKLNRTFGAELVECSVRKIDD